MAHILIIDDDVDVTRLLETHLRDEGHTVTITHDCKDGMSQLLRNPPDLIMLDVFLPDATGYQMCNRIRKNEPTQTTPIIMMTGAARFPNQQMYGRQRGANEYIFKPFNIVEVGDLVRKYMPVEETPHPEAAPPIEEPPKKEDSNFAALSAFLKRTMAPSPRPDAENDSEPPMKSVPQVPDPIEPLAVFGRITIETPMPTPTNGYANGNGHHFDLLPVTPAPEPEPVPAPPTPPSPPPLPVEEPIPMRASHAPVENYVPPSLDGQERFVEFGLELIALASRLCSTQAEKYLADQLLRTSLSVGAQIHAAQFTASPDAFYALMSSALHNLRETGYWLMMTNKTGLLERCGKTDLEQTCLSLTSLLVHFQKPR